MARKSKRSREVGKSGPRELNPNDAKIGELTTYEDVADSEDEFYLNQDKIVFDEDPIAKRRRLNHDPAFDGSDEEIIDLEDLPSSDEEDDSEEDNLNGATNGLSLSDDDDENEESDGGEQDEYADWGKSKSAYYDANDLDNDEDAAMEEAEARRLQRKQLQSMSAKDFGVDEDDWKQPDNVEDAARTEKEDDTTPSVFSKKKIQIPESDEDKLELLHLLHPEFEHLRNEYTRLAPLHKDIEAKGKNRDSSSVVRKRWVVLTAYLGVLSMYFALLTQERPKGETVDIRDHSIMDALVKWRMMWLDMEKIEDEATPEPETKLIGEMGEMDVDEVEMEDEAEELVVKPVTNGVKVKTGNGIKEKSKRVISNSTTTKEAKRLAKSDARLKDLDDLLPTFTKPQKSKKSKPAVQFKDDDFGEEDFIYEEDAEEKAKRKKSLRFYTAQIHQKSNKRDRAGRDAGGDMDIPHRERNKEKQERLNAEAQRRGMADSLGDDLDLDGDYDDNDLASARQLKDQIEGDGVDDALEYYNQVATKSKLEKLKKRLEHEASVTTERINDTDTIDPATGKRAIGYTIEKNKGLTPHRKKDVRNPRVKKRKKYEAAKKKLGSKKAVYKAPTSAYSGEATGIRTKIIKSVKFS
ncbi:hypothetical protein ABW19_dt0208410 [Dactylella cylindrospora]|nr:hypothetical protein ABW19_dt0208410 [Dactylella cylindrospora]